MITSDIPCGGSGGGGTADTRPIALNRNCSEGLVVTSQSIYGSDQVTESWVIANTTGGASWKFRRITGTWTPGSYSTGLVSISLYNAAVLNANAQYITATSSDGSAYVVNSNPGWLLLDVNPTKANVVTLNVDVSATRPAPGSYV